MAVSRRGLSDDVRQVYLRVTVALGLAILFVTQPAFDRLLRLGAAFKWLLLAGLALDPVAAVLYYEYSNGLNLARLQMAKCLRAPDADGAAEIRAGSGIYWTNQRLVFFSGNLCLVGSVVALGTVLDAMLHLISQVSGRPRVGRGSAKIPSTPARSSES